MERIVIALGGNALLDPYGRQSFSKESSNLAKVCDSIAGICMGRSIVITHGNGSQVGDELERNEHAKKYVPKLPFYILNAETQASIGTAIATSLRNSLAKLKVRIGVTVILANVIVDRNDPAFKRPSKPVGPFYTAAELEKELRLDGFDYITHGSMYRRVVASPTPLEILELDAIRKGASGNIVITCGGGGTPTLRTGKGITGIDAVIDKDSTSQLLASSLRADALIILTNADYVYRDYTKKEGAIEETTARELKRMLAHFEQGTMRPKVEACIRFVEKGGKEAYIGNVFKLGQILSRESGTRIR